MIDLKKTPSAVEVCGWVIAGAAACVGMNLLFCWLLGGI